MASRCVFVTGATGYMGRALIPELLARGHGVRALVRPGSEGRVPAGAVAVRGNALEGDTFADAVAPADTLVHLVGTPHPNPSKAASFRSVDLVSVDASLVAARRAGIRHFIYVSVAQPAPVMREYVAVRAEGEARIRASGIPATFVRPWYVLGPGHYWPYAFMPLYYLFLLLPPTRETARRLGLVTLGQMVATLVQAVERGGEGVVVVEVGAIRARSGPE